MISMGAEMNDPGRKGSAGVEISAVLPAHNEVENLAAVVRPLAAALERLVDRFEIVIVNDGSSDGTADLADKLALEDERVHVVHHAVNQGYGAALVSGFDDGCCDWLFFTDADGQFDVCEIKSLVELAGEHDFIVGYREARDDPWHRRLYGRLFSWSVRTLFGVNVRDVNCAYKLFRRDLIAQAPLQTRGALINAEILVVAKQKGVDPVEVPVTHRPRRHGEQSGGSVKVIARAARELLELWLKTKR